MIARPGNMEIQLDLFLDYSPTADDIEHFVRVAAKYKFWLGSREENGAVGITLL